MLETHALGDLVADLGADQLTEQLVGVGEGGGGTLAGGDVAVDGDEVGGVLGTGTLQGLLEARLAGGTAALEQSQGSQHDGWCRTDGGHLLASGHLIADGLAHALVVVQVGGAGHSSGQHDEVGIRRVNLLKLQVGLDVHPVGRLYQREVRGAHCYYVNTPSAQHVDGYQGLDIFEAIS